jgi:hypothetical protein
MTMSKDRHDADPAIETPAPQSMAPAETQDPVGETANDHEALAAVEGAEAASPDKKSKHKASHDKAPHDKSSNDNTATDATPSPEAEAVEAKGADVSPADDPDRVEATAVLVLDDEPVALAEPPETDASDVDWAAALAETELSELPATDHDDFPLLDDELEHGIASVFATLHAAALRGDVGDAEEAASPLSETDAIDGITFRLLGELDRLWHRAA